MVSSQTIIERSLYCSLLKTAISLGYTLDPENYYPISPENSLRFTSDKQEIIDSKGCYLSIYGIGNNQSRGIKECPRITLESKGFMPGDMGLPKQIIEKSDNDFFVSEFPFEAIDQYIDIHLVANNQEDMRLLHVILYSSIPQRGYIKPYNLEEPPFDGNIFLEISNFYDLPNTDKGIMEKVYEYTVKDSILEELVKDLPEPIVPINAMEILLQRQYTYTGKVIPPVLRGNDSKLFRGKEESKELLKLEK